MPCTARLSTCLDVSERTLPTDNEFIVRCGGMPGAVTVPSALSAGAVRLVADVPISAVELEDAVT
jgi:hypothetical protein